MLAERYGDARAERIARRAQDAHRALLPTLHPILLARDLMAPLALAATWGLALYQGSLPEGGTAEDVGWVLVTCLDRIYVAVPAWLRRLAGAAFMSAPSRWIIAALGRRSQRRGLPYTFVWRVPAAEEHGADLAIDYLQCPINSLLRDHGAGELAPYFCQTDYATFGALGLGFRRTGTLAWDCSHCDFRMWRKGETDPSWPPRFAERHCGRASELAPGIQEGHP
ncbi:MAG: L-2-amino-thiazoline-4-carboxylic acid hydrolase [Anaerolineae bacterium]